MIILAVLLILVCLLTCCANLTSGNFTEEVDDSITTVEYPFAKKPKTETSSTGYREASFLKVMGLESPLEVTSVSDKTVHVCANCGQNIEENVFEILIKELKDGELKDTFDIEICSTCFKYLAAFMTSRE